MEILKYKKSFAVAVAFAILAFSALFTNAFANADEKAAYQFESHYAFYPDAPIDYKQSTITKTGELLFVGQNQNKREVCKIQAPGKTPQCVDITAQTVEISPAGSSVGSIITDDDGNLFITFTNGSAYSVLLAVEMKIEDLSFTWKRVYNGEPFEAPGLLTHFPQNMAFINGGRIFYGILSNISDTGNAGPLYMISSTVGQNNTFLWQLPCPDEATTCATMDVTAGQTLVMPNGNHLLSLTYSDGTPGYKQWLLLVDGDNYVADRVVNLGTSTTNSAPSTALDSENNLVLTDNTNQMYRFNLGEGTKIDAPATLTLPLASISKMTTDQKGNAFIEGKTSAQAALNSIYEVDKSNGISLITFPDDYASSNMFALPDGCTYFTGNLQGKTKTDLLRFCSDNNEAEFINSFDFLQGTQTAVLFTGKTSAQSALAAATNPDVYVFSSNTAAPGADTNDYAVLKYKDLPTPAPTPTPPAPTPPSPSPLPDTGFELKDFLLAFGALTLISGSLAIYRYKSI
ncbi:MAG: hypothetical protein LBB07_00800 [Bifidobacteriaceae bacterium]|jgi:hypothetical protein|nr:hypothetical protein [Bifidobacteriaceae bacterium]